MITMTYHWTTWAFIVAFYLLGCWRIGEIVAGLI